jgi:hypothetical protein
MLDLPEFVWSDIESIVRHSLVAVTLRRTSENMAAMREGIDQIVELVDLERARQVRRSMLPSASEGREI